LPLAGHSVLDPYLTPTHTRTRRLSQVANRALTPLIKQQSQLFFFGALNDANLRHVYDTITIKPRQDFREFQAWVDEHVVDYNFGVWSQAKNMLQTIKAT
jgi:hypothetical protein